MAFQTPSHWQHGPYNGPTCGVHQRVPLPLFHCAATEGNVPCELLDGQGLPGQSRLVNLVELQKQPGAGSRQAWVVQLQPPLCVG